MGDKSSLVRARHQSEVQQQPILHVKNAMGKCVYHIIVAACLLLGFEQATATVLFADPQDVTVEANQWAQFNCTVSCSYTSTVSWYMAGYRRAIKRNNTIPGLLIKRSYDVKCISTIIENTYFFEVYATEALNRSTFYCAAYMKHNQEKRCSCGKGGRCYSRPALLTVRTAATVNPPTQTSVTQTPTPSNCCASDPTSSSPSRKEIKHTSSF